MKRFKLAFQEKISIWQNVDIIVEAESKEELMSSIANGALYENHKITEQYTEPMWGTEKNLDYDYYGIPEEDIEEIIRNTIR